MHDIYNRLRLNCAYWYAFAKRACAPMPTPITLGSAPEIAHCESNNCQVKSYFSQGIMHATMAMLFWTLHGCNINPTTWDNLGYGTHFQIHCNSCWYIDNYHICNPFFAIALIKYFTLATVYIRNPYKILPLHHWYPWNPCFYWRFWIFNAK